MNRVKSTQLLRTGSGIGQGQAVLTLALAALLLHVAILGSFHHHSHLTGHPDCSVCNFVQHSDATVAAQPVLAGGSLPALPPTYLLPAATPATAAPVSLRHSRAPPL